MIAVFRSKLALNSLWKVVGLVITLQLGAGLLHVGGRLGYFGTNFELPGYTTARVYAAYRLNANVTIRADIDNLFDEEFYVNSFSELWVQPGAPTTWRISAEFGF